MKHHPRGGSNADRDLNCALAYSMRQALPNTESEYAKLGTAKHDCMEQIVLGAVDGPDHYRGMTVNGIVVDDDFIDDLKSALVAWELFVANHAIEEWEPEAHCIKDAETGGYADVVAASPVRVWIVDWKFGKGIQVFPDENPQGLFYTMCGRIESPALDLFEGKTKFGFAIIQPNDRDLDDLRTWEFEAEDLEKFEKQYAQAVLESEVDDPQPTPGEHCRFCPGAALCSGKIKAAEEAMKMDPSDLDILGESMERVADLKAWIKDVETTVFDQLRAGAPVEGWKLVLKRATARWVDEDTVIRKLRRKMGGIAGMTTRKILSPAQMKKKAKEKDLQIDFDAFIVSNSSGETLAPESDKRPAVGATGSFVGAILANQKDAK